MTVLVPIALFGFIPVALAMFWLMPARRAVFTAMIGGYMFLPNAQYHLSGLPNYTKSSAICYGVFLGILLFDTDRLLRFRLAWIDLPMVIWCVSPFFSSLANDLGAYDGLSAIVQQMLIWGLPYFIGRLYLTDLDALKEFSLVFLMGGLILVPLALLEVRLSPQMHRWVYGFYSNPFMHNIRFGGFRPTLFMASGLALGMFMVAATLSAWWLQSTRAVKLVWGVPLFWLVPVLVVTTLLVKATGATLLFVIALAAMYATRWTKLTAPLLCLLLIAPAYTTLRTTQLWDGRIAVELAEEYIDRARAQSLEFRLDNEDILIDKALQRPLLGWGRWGRSRVYNDEGRDISVTDGLWVIVLGQQGLVGVTALTLAFLLPPVVVVRRFGYRLVTLPALAPAAIWVGIVALYAVDNQLNAMPNPLFMTALGGVAAIAASRIRLAKPTRATAAPRASQPHQPTIPPTAPPQRRGPQQPIPRLGLHRA
jgi:hypothetical protein